MKCPIFIIQGENDEYGSVKQTSENPGCFDPYRKKLASKASVILEEFDASVSSIFPKEEKKQFLSLTQKLIGTTTST
jgi:hypothetical protein